MKNRSVDSGSVSESDSRDNTDGPASKRKKSNKNPDVDTSFLPDRDREEEENKLREELRQVWGNRSVEFESP